MNSCGGCRYYDPKTFYCHKYLCGTESLKECSLKQEEEENKKMRKTVNCRHCLRIPKKTYVETRCDIDNHYIGYVECFEGWCRRWAKDHTFDKEAET